MRKLTFDNVDIKVPNNWKITYNTLTTFDPLDKSLSKEELEHNSLWLLKDNLLQINSTDHLIDLGWPHDEFVLVLLKKDNSEADWSNPSYKLKTKSLEKVLLS